MKRPDISSLEHTSWRGQYHVVFVPKYRRMEIYRKIRVDIGVILRKLCRQKGVEIIKAMRSANLFGFLKGLCPYKALRAYSCLRLSRRF